MEKHQIEGKTVNTLFKLLNQQIEAFLYTSEEADKPYQKDVFEIYIEEINRRYLVKLINTDNEYLVLIFSELSTQKITKDDCLETETVFDTYGAKKLKEKLNEEMRKCLVARMI